MGAIPGRALLQQHALSVPSMNSFDREMRDQWRQHKSARKADHREHCSQNQSVVTMQGRRQAVTRQPIIFPFRPGEVVFARKSIQMGEIDPEVT